MDFQEIVKLIGCFCKNVTLSAKTYCKADLEEQNLSNSSSVHLGMGVAETWRGTPDGRLRAFLLTVM